MKFTFIRPSLKNENPIFVSNVLSEATATEKQLGAQV